MEKMLKDLGNMIRLMPTPDNDSPRGHIKAHKVIPQLFSILLKILTDFLDDQKDTNFNLKEQSNILQMEISNIKKDMTKIPKVFDSMQDQFSTLSSSIFHLETNIAPKVSEESGIATQSGHIIFQGNVKSISYNISKLEFKNVENHYFQTSVVNGQSLLKIFFDNKTDQGGAIVYDLSVIYF